MSCRSRSRTRAGARPLGLALGVTLGVAACQPATVPTRAPDAAVPPGSQPAASQPTDDPFVPLARSQHSGLADARELAVRDAATWRATWPSLQGAVTDGGAPPDPPAVDFARDMVLVVAAGERPTGGWDVRVDAVERGSDGGATVRYTITGPGAGCMTTQAITAPVVAVRATRAAGTVRFAGRTERRDC